MARIVHEPAGAPSAKPRVCICILNWNGWRDTVECLESVLRIQDPAYQVIVVDNGSADDSVDRMLGWARGEVPAALHTPEGLQRLVAPAVAKPVACRALSAEELEALDAGGLAGERLLLVRNPANLGFAAGLNVALRYVLRSGRFDYAWLLNNDTVVEPTALAQLVARMTATPRAGLCGSTLLFYDEPDTVQALGGFRYNLWLGRSSQIGQLGAWDAHAPHAAAAAERAMFGVQGASVLVTAQFLREVGLLAEDYFLYFEEQDWAVRARRHGFRIAYAADSIVYHKEGRSTGNQSRARADRSETADFYQLQARLLFTRKHFPYALPTVYLGLAGVVVNRLRRRQFRRAAAVAKLAVQTLGSSQARHPAGASVRDGARAGVGEADR